MKKHQGKFNRRPPLRTVSKSRAKTWVKAYLVALFDNVPVSVIPKYQRELDNILT